MRSFRLKFRLIEKISVIALATGLGSTTLVSRAIAQQDDFTDNYFESFEDPLGADLSIDGPGGLASQPCPAGSSESAPDCVRGQRTVVPTTLVCPFDEQFLPGRTVFVRPDRDDWHIHTENTPDLSGVGKAFEGLNSLHWGRHTHDSLGTPGDTYCLACVNAFVGPDINLAKNEISTLSFWHIAEFCDIDCFSFLPDTGDDYSIVEVRMDQHASPNKTEWSAWERLEPNFGVYDGTQDTFYSSPTFEPDDDINPDPAAADPEVTMCLPLLMFLSQGSARGLDATGCSDGDGNDFPDCGHGPLEDDPSLRTPDRVSHGETGVGVWVQSKFDLSRYAGRHIQYRFLATTLDDGFNQFISYLENTEGGPALIPAELDIDDGWYIDAITITNTTPIEGRLGPPSR